MEREAGARPAVSPFGEVVNPGRVWSSKRHAKFFWTEIPMASNLFARAVQIETPRWNGPVPFSGETHDHLNFN